MSEKRPATGTQHVIIYSPWCSSKSAWFSFLCRTHMKYVKMKIFCRTFGSKHHSLTFNIWSWTKKQLQQQQQKIFIFCIPQKKKKKSYSFGPQNFLFLLKYTSVHLCLSRFLAPIKIKIEFYMTIFQPLSLIFKGHSYWQQIISTKWLENDSLSVRYDDVRWFEVTWATDQWGEFNSMQMRCGCQWTFTFIFMRLAERDLQCVQGINFISFCVPNQLNPWSWRF